MGKKNKKCKNKVTWGVETTSSSIYDDALLIREAKERKKNEKHKKGDGSKKSNHGNAEMNKHHKRNHTMTGMEIIELRKREAKEKFNKIMGTIDIDALETDDENTDNNIMDSSIEEDSGLYDKNQDDEDLIETADDDSDDETTDENNVVDDEEDDVLNTDNTDNNDSSSLLFSSRLNILASSKPIITTRVEHLSIIDRVIITDTISPHSIDIRDLNSYQMLMDCSKLTNDEFADCVDTLFYYIIASTHPALILSRDVFLKVFRKYQVIDSKRFLILESDDHEYFAIWNTPDSVNMQLLALIPQYYDMNISEYLRFLAVLAVEGNKISNVFKMSNDEVSKEYVDSWVRYLISKYDSIDIITEKLLSNIDDDHRTVIYETLDGVPEDAAEQLAFNNFDLKMKAHELATSVCYFQEIALYEDNFGDDNLDNIPNVYETDDEDDDEDDSDENTVTSESNDDGNGGVQMIMDITDDTNLKVVVNPNDADDDLPTNFPVRTKT